MDYIKACLTLGLYRHIDKEYIDQTYNKIISSITDKTEQDIIKTAYKVISDEWEGNIVVPATITQLSRNKKETQGNTHYTHNTYNTSQENTHYTHNYNNFNKNNSTQESYNKIYYKDVVKQAESNQNITDLSSKRIYFDYILHFTDNTSQQIGGSLNTPENNVRYAKILISKPANKISLLGKEIDIRKVDTININDNYIGICRIEVVRLW